jgi:mannose-1-phosphate guanylyltransferase
MKAAILCAGSGTRLQPLTNTWPKAAVPLLGLPLFRYILAAVKHAGIRAVGINTHHLAEQMAPVAAAECLRTGISLTISNEPEIQGTGGGIRGLRSFLEDDTFLVINGDILFSFELIPLIEAHRASRALATMALMPMPKGERFAAVEVDSQDEVKRIAGQGVQGQNLRPKHFASIHVINPDIFNYMSPSGAEDINRDVYVRALEQGRVVKGCEVRGYWSDLGTPSRYLAAQADLLEQRVALLPEASPFSDADRRGPTSWARAGAVFEGTTEGPSFFDAGCIVSAGARVGSAVYVGAAARVEAGAELERSAVLGGTTVRAGEKLVDAIAWGEHRLIAQLR